MSKKKRKRPPAQRPRAAPAEKPAEATPAPRPGLFGSFLGGVGSSPFGTIRTALRRGFVTAGASPVLVAGVFLLVLVYWLGILAAGVRMQPFGLFDVAGIPPIGTRADANAAGLIGGATAGIWILIAMTAVRALVVSLFAGLIVVSLERDERPTSAGLRRGLRAFPAVLGTNIGAFGLFVVTNNLLPILGPGFGTLGQLLVPAAMLFFLGFVPAAAARKRMGLTEALRRSIAAARLPGGRHFMFSLLYVAVAFIGLPITGFLAPELGRFGADPGVRSWAVILLANVVHMGFFAAYCYRWMVVEDLVPDAPPPRRRAAAGRR